MDKATEHAIEEHYGKLRLQQPKEIGPDDLNAFDEFDAHCIEETAKHFGVTTEEVARIVHGC
jgi:hypothetical protein